jgi:phage gp37-like protein
MGYKIAEIEDAILTAMQADADLSSACKTIDSFGGEAADLLAQAEQMIIPVPAVWVAFTGSDFTEAANRSYDEAMNFIFLIASKDLRGRSAAARGAYEIIEMLKSLLIDNNLGLDIEPLHPVSLDIVGITNRLAVYGLSFKTSFSTD